jgi:glycosyltransferase involved in cell wall biosynthesis
MDGGSTDSSIDVLKTFSRRVRWRSEADAGQSEALNKAFRESKGEILGWLNSDDAYFSRNAVASAVAVFQRNPDVHVVYGHAALVNAAGRILQMMWVPPYIPRLLLVQNYLVQPAVFFRRSAVGAYVANEGYDYAIDRELWLRLGRKSKFRRLNSVLAIDRHHLERKSYTRPDLLHADSARLAATYGIATGWTATVRNRALAIVYRQLGVTLVAQAYADDLAFPMKTDPLAQLVFRQMARRRKGMPVGAGWIGSGAIAS